MKKEYQDHWVNMEDMHLLTRWLRIWQFFVNFMQGHGYIRNESYKGKDPFHMTDDELVKRLRDFYNGKPYIEASEPETPIREVLKRVAKEKPSTSLTPKDHDVPEKAKKRWVHKRDVPKSNVKKRW